MPLSESFPYQAIQMLRKQGKDFYAPEIIAKTGWTTDELLSAIAATTLLPKYDFVSLLIGVNNQYRGRDTDNFKNDFSILLNKAIRFAGNSKKVFVLSIPDWGVTPFASGKDNKKIADEINAFNEVCRTISAEHQVNFIDITTSQRNDAGSSEFLAADCLHPSGAEYFKWAKLLSNAISHSY